MATLVQMLTSIRLRKFSYLFLALGVLSPLVPWWFVKHAERSYIARFGVSPEGTGFFAMSFMGAVATLVFLLLSTICALWSFRGLASPRAMIRNIEVTLLCLPPLAVTIFMLFGLLGLGYDLPQVIQSN
jgi:hypothetical protein